MADKNLNEIQFNPVSAWETMDETKTKDVLNFGEGYIDFLNQVHTERQSADFIITKAKESGYDDFNDVITGKIKFVPGNKYYYCIHGKSVILAATGSEDPANGVNIVGSHIDAPRLDFKPNPFYEDNGFGYAKTHYYGGIKKYQWTAIPLMLKGVVFTNDGKKIDISIGDKPEDPMFTITDLLPHLAADQMKKGASEFIPAENLNILLGSMPLNDEEGNGSIKAYIINYLYEKYGIVQRDMATAEIEVVPAFKACSIGFDKSFTGGYGQDDRVCAYASLMGILDINEPLKKTAICYFSDKEEVGSMGNTGARSVAFNNFIAELCYAYDNKDSEIRTRRALASSNMLSADVSAGFDPNFAEAFDKTNCAYISRGVAMEKYTGSRGKSGASDANPEFIAKVVNIFNKAGVPWQISEMGRMDLGGGGTIAQFMADLGINIIDCGVPVLSMHAPFEVTSKADLYWTYKAYYEFMINM
ncbi:MAG: aminopeptidase [Ruminococcaceae bacterium]|nr:aminopeptidase [Oscillospiraceae bacterium]